MNNDSTENESKMYSFCPITYRIKVQKLSQKLQKRLFNKKTFTSQKIAH